MNDYIKDFPMKEEKYIYFNSASTSYKPKKVIEAMNDYYHHYSVNIARGVDSLGFSVTEKYENVRAKVAKFIDCEKNEVVFTRGTTESINLVAYGIEHLLNEGDEIIVSVSEHHANLIPWQELAKRKHLTLKIIDIDDLYNNLEKEMTDKTVLVAINHVSNVLGIKNDIKRLAEIAHKKNALILIDGAQGIVHETVSMKDTNVDFYAFSGHKMYGPMGVGVLYGKKEHLEKLKPLMYGGEMIDIVEEQTSTYKQAPHKFEGGTMMIPEVLGLGAAIDYIEEVGQVNINNHIKNLRDYLIKNTEEMPLTIYNKEVDTSLITFNFNNIHSHDVASVLDRHNIIVRAGHHCASLVHKKLNTTSSVRISIALYNTKEECDLLIDALKKVGDYIDVLFK